MLLHNVTAVPQEGKSKFKCVQKLEETAIQMIKDRQTVKLIQSVWLSITLIGLLPFHLVVSLTISCIPHEL